MTPKQLRMAIGATGITLRALAQETGLDPSQISRIQSCKAGAHTKTIERLQAAFTRRGIRFEQRAGEVGVFANDQEDGNQGATTE